MRYKVPQNIDIQDKILGPLTMIQFIYAVVGGGICYAIYMSMPKPFSYFLVMPIALFVVALIFLKINERPFLDFIISVLEFSSAPKKRMWHHTDMPDLQVQIYHVQNSNGPAIQAKVVSKEQISAIARQLDEGVKRQ